MLPYQNITGPLTPTNIRISARSTSATITWDELTGVADEIVLESNNNTFPV